MIRVCPFDCTTTKQEIWYIMHACIYTVLYYTISYLFVPNATCHEIQNSLQQQQQQQQQSSTTSDCRSNAAYNYFFWRCCQASILRYECETHVHNTLFHTKDNEEEDPPTTLDYNPAVPPLASMSGTNNDPLDVSVQLQYEALEHMDVEDGTSTIFVTLIMTWNDPRLRWNITPNTTCASYVNVRC